MIASAVTHCSLRGLRTSSQFAAEMLASSTSTTSSNTTTTTEPQSHAYLLAKTCFDRGEYLRAAHTLRNLPLTTRGVDGASTPASCDLLAYFLRCYSLYLAGEKRREEVQAERGGPQNHWAPGLAQGTSQGGATAAAPDPSGGAAPHGARQSSGILSGKWGGSGAGNDNLSLLHGELTNLYKDGLLDGFLLYLYGVVLRDLGMRDRARGILCEAVVAYPLNWSAWLDLSLLCPERASLLDVQRTLNQRTGKNFIDEHWIAQCFMGHALMEQQEHEQAKEYYEHLYQLFPTSVYLKSAMAKTHYNAREFDQARALYESLRSDDPYRLDGMDLYSNILFVKGERAQLSHLAHNAMKIDKYRPQTCCIVGNYYSLKGQHERAVIYFRRALKLDPHYLAAWTLMGHEYVELRNTQAAIQAYRRAVDIDDRDYRAWYGLGQTYEILKMHNYAIYYYRKAVQLRPYDSRMWLAVGKCFSILKKTEYAISSYKRAYKHQDREGIAAFELGKLYSQKFAKNQSDTASREEAAIYFEKHVEMHDQVGGHGYTEYQESLLFLGRYHFQEGNFDAAETQCRKLLDAGSHQESEEAKALLRDIRAAQSGGGGVGMGFFGEQGNDAGMKF